MSSRQLPQKITFILLIFNSIFSLPAGAATFTVTNLNNSNLGSLRQAIINANSSPGSDTIVFAPSVSGTILLTSGVMGITGNLIINGPEANVLTISGNHASPIFSISSNATVTINGVAIENGYNEYGHGGGINNAGTLTLNNSTLSGSSVGGARGGGGIYNAGTLTLNNITLSGCSASYGGGIYNEKGTLTITNSTLSDNTTAYGGGGIDSYQGTITITNSILSKNSVQYGGGGGISLSDGTLNVISSTLSDNSASVYTGGGIKVEGGTLNVTNSTLSGNSAGEGGGWY